MSRKRNRNNQQKQQTQKVEETTPVVTEETSETTAIETNNTLPEETIDQQPGEVTDETTLEESTVEPIVEEETEETETTFEEDEENPTDDDVTGDEGEETEKPEESEKPEEKVEYEDAYAIIAKLGSTKEALETIAESNCNPQFIMLANKILSFNSYGTGPLFTIGHSYDIMQTFKAALKNKTEQERRTVLAIIKTGYKAFEKEGFSTLKLFRFLDQWRWSKKELDALTGMHGMFSALIQGTPDKTIKVDEVLNLLGLDEEVEATFKSYFKLV